MPMVDSLAPSQFNTLCAPVSAYHCIGSPICPVVQHKRWKLQSKFSYQSVVNFRAPVVFSSKTKLKWHSTDSLIVSLVSSFLKELCNFCPQKCQQRAQDQSHIFVVYCMSSSSFTSYLLTMPCSVMCLYVEVAILVELPLMTYDLMTGSIEQQERSRNHRDPEWMKWKQGDPFNSGPQIEHLLQ